MSPPPSVRRRWTKSSITISPQAAAPTTPLAPAFSTDLTSDTVSSPPLVRARTGDRKTRLEAPLIALRRRGRALRRIRGPSLGGGVPLLAARPRLGRLGLAVLRRRRGHQLAEELGRDSGDRVDGALERLRVRARGLVESADLPDVLDGRGADLLIGCNGLEVVERSDVSAHADSLDAAPRRAAKLTRER